MTNEEIIKGLDLACSSITGSFMWTVNPFPILRDYIHRLQSENAALRERLEKAVEFIVQPGEIVYIPWVKNGNSGIAELPIVDIRVYKGRDIGYRVDLSRCDGEYMWTAPKPFYSHSEFGHTIFTTREAAEARLAELKGEKE